MNYDGIFPALLTPFDGDEKIAHLELKKMVRYLEKFDFQGFYVGGSTGEGMMMSNEERKSVFKTVAESVTNNKLLLCAHIGTTSQAGAIDMGLYAKSLGFPLISAVAPYYYSFKKDDILNYYRAISKAVDLPFIIYNFPGGANFVLDVHSLNDLFQDTNFVGIKHTSLDLFSVANFREAQPNISIYNGLDEVLLAGLSMGASGGIGSTYNIMPNIIINIYKCFKEGNLEKAMTYQNKACEVINVLIQHGVFASEKYLLSKQGIEMGDCRAPFAKLSKSAKEVLDAIVL